MYIYMNIYRLTYTAFLRPVLTSFTQKQNIDERRMWGLEKNGVQMLKK